MECTSKILDPGSYPEWFRTAPRTCETMTNRVPRHAGHKPTDWRLTGEAVYRLADLYASAPLMPREVDEELYRKGWIVICNDDEIYPAWTSKVFYDSSGGVASWVKRIRS